MNRICLFAAFICAFALCASAEDVYILRPKTESSEGADLWARNMSLNAESVAFYAPLAFTASPTEVSYSRNVNMTYSAQNMGVIARRGNCDILRFIVTFSKKPLLPKATTAITVKITVSEMNQGGILAESPGFAAMEKAILQSGYTKGNAWIQSIRYDKKDTFTVKVALKK